MFNLDPSDPVTQAQIGGVVRSLLIAAGGFGLTGDDLSKAAGIIAMVIGLGWSIYQKRRSMTQVQQTTVTHAVLAEAVQAAAANPNSAPAIIAAAKAGQF